MNHDTLQIHAWLFVVNTATIYPSAKPAVIFGENASTLIYCSPLSITPQQSFLLWLCFSLGQQQQWHKEPFKPDVEQTCKVRAAKQASGAVSVQRDGASCWSREHMTTRSVDTKALSTQRAALLRLNLCGGFEQKPRHLSRNLCPPPPTPPPPQAAQMPLNRWKQAACLKVPLFYVSCHMFEPQSQEWRRLIGF